MITGWKESSTWPKNIFVFIDCMIESLTQLCPQTKEFISWNKLYPDIQEHVNSTYIKKLLPDSFLPSECQGQVYPLKCHPVYFFFPPFPIPPNIWIWKEPRRMILHNLSKWNKLCRLVFIIWPLLAMATSPCEKSKSIENPISPWPEWFIWQTWKDQLTQLDKITISNKSNSRMSIHNILRKISNTFKLHFLLIIANRLGFTF